MVGEMVETMVATKDKSTVDRTGENLVVKMVY